MTLNTLFKRALSETLFPSCCLSCEEEAPGALLCSGCLAFLDLVDPLQRCARCFGDNRQNCSCEERIFDREAYCFAASPVSEILALEIGNLLSLPQLLASYLLIQFQAARFEADVVIVAEEHFLKKLLQCGHKDHLLAKSFAALQGIPYQSLIGSIDGEIFHVKKRIEGQRILVIGLKRPKNAEGVYYALKEAGPCTLYGLFLSH